MRIHNHTCSPLTRFIQALSRAFTSACDFRCRPFPILRLQTTQRLRLEETVQSWCFERPSYVPPGFNNIFDGLRSRQELLFSYFGLEISFSSSSFFDKQYFPSCLSQISAGLRLSRPYLCASLASSQKATISTVVFRPRSFNHTEAQGLLRSFVQGSSPHHPAFSVIVQNLEAHGKCSPLSFRHTILLSFYAEPLLMPKYSTGNSSGLF